MSEDLKERIRLAVDAAVVLGRSDGYFREPISVDGDRLDGEYGPTAVSNSKILIACAVRIAVEESIRLLTFEQTLNSEPVTQAPPSSDVSLEGLDIFELQALCKELQEEISTAHKELDRQGSPKTYATGGMLVDRHLGGRIAALVEKLRGGSQS